MHDSLNDDIWFSIIKYVDCTHSLLFSKSSAKYIASLWLARYKNTEWTWAKQIFVISLFKLQNNNEHVWELLGRYWFNINEIETFSWETRVKIHLTYLCKGCGEASWMHLDRYKIIRHSEKCPELCIKCMNNKSLKWSFMIYHSFATSVCSEDKLSEIPYYEVNNTYPVYPRNMRYYFYTDLVCLTQDNHIDRRCWHNIDCCACYPTLSKDFSLWEREMPMIGLPRRSFLKFKMWDKETQS